MEDSAVRLRHDEAVQRLALLLLSKGFNVEARIEGWFNPPEIINGYRPDIIARLGNEVLIIEIKKGDVDWPKITALEQYDNEQGHLHVRVFSPTDDLTGDILRQIHEHGR
jgi:hypothetical protein